MANPCISIQGKSCSGLKNGTVKILSQVGGLLRAWLQNFMQWELQEGPFQ